MGGHSEVGAAPENSGAAKRMMGTVELLFTTHYDKRPRETRYRCRHFCAIFRAGPKHDENSSPNRASGIHARIHERAVNSRASGTQFPAEKLHAAQPRPDALERLRDHHPLRQFRRAEDGPRRGSARRRLLDRRRVVRNGLRVERGKHDARDLQAMCQRRWRCVSRYGRAINR